MALVKQPSKLPTRKIMAVILSGMILGAIQSLLKMFWPDHPFAPYMEDIDVWLQGLIMIMAGYMTKEREDGPVEQTSEVQGSTDSGSSQLVFDPLWGEQEGTGSIGDGKQITKGQGGPSE